LFGFAFTDQLEIFALTSARAVLFFAARHTRSDISHGANTTIAKALTTTRAQDLATFGGALAALHTGAVFEGFFSTTVGLPSGRDPFSFAHDIFFSLLTTLQFVDAQLFTRWFHALVL
tara:strand:- start:7621 stop:7974 length:354 start_codon:yes stop_codon:yes gene_type:complete